MVLDGERGFECIAKSRRFTRVPLKFTAQLLISPQFTGKNTMKFFWKSESQKWVEVLIDG